MGFAVLGPSSAKAKASWGEQSTGSSDVLLRTQARPGVWAEIPPSRNTGKTQSREFGSYCQCPTFGNTTVSYVGCL